MIRTLLLIAAVFLAPLPPLAVGAELLTISWPTHSAAHPPKLSPEADAMLPAFRIALSALPEAGAITLALSQPTLLGLSPAEATELRPLVQERYRLLSQSAVYARAPSALPYCYAAERPTQGSASIYVPGEASAATPVILFLHGYGGSFVWYQHWLSEAFPNHIIVCPAYGISSGLVPPEYLTEALGACARRLGFPLSRPCLIGLSAGGFGACRAFVAESRKYTQLICLAAYPPDETLYRFPADAPARFLSGAAEPFVVSGDLGKRIETIRHRSTSVELRTIPGGDHFFMLTRHQETRALLQRWLNGAAAR